MTADLKQANIEDSKIYDLERIATGFGIEFPADEYSNDELLRLGIGYGVPGALSDERVRREATELLEEL